MSTHSSDSENGSQADPSELPDVNNTPTHQSTVPRQPSSAPPPPSRRRSRPADDSGAGDTSSASKPAKKAKKAPAALAAANNAAQEDTADAMTQEEAEWIDTRPDGGFLNTDSARPKFRKMKWTTENDRSLLLFGLGRDISGDEYPAIANSFQEKPTAKAIQERLTKLRAQTRRVLREASIFDADAVLPAALQALSRPSVVHQPPSSQQRPTKKPPASKTPTTPAPPGPVTPTGQTTQRPPAGPPRPLQPASSTTPVAPGAGTHTIYQPPPGPPPGMQSYQGPPPHNFGGPPYPYPYPGMGMGMGMQNWGGYQPGSGGHHSANPYHQLPRAINFSGGTGGFQVPPPGMPSSQQQSSPFPHQQHPHPHPAVESVPQQPDCTVPTPSRPNTGEMSVESIEEDDGENADLRRSERELDAMRAKRDEESRHFGGM